MPSSSPKMACVGKRSRTSARMAASAPLSAMVTGDASFLSSISSGVRKYLTVISAAASTRSAARVTYSAGTSDAAAAATTEAREAPRWERVAIDGKDFPRVPPTTRDERVATSAALDACGHDSGRIGSTKGTSGPCSGRNPATRDALWRPAARLTAAPPPKPPPEWITELTFVKSSCHFARVPMPHRRSQPPPGWTPTG